MPPAAYWLYWLSFESSLTVGGRDGRRLLGDAFIFLLLRPDVVDDTEDERLLVPAGFLAAGFRPAASCSSGEGCQKVLGKSK